MINQLSLDVLLQRVDVLDREIRQLRRDLLRGVRNQPVAPMKNSSLFGSVNAGDIAATARFYGANFLTKDGIIQASNEVDVN